MPAVPGEVPAKTRESRVTGLILAAVLGACYLYAFPYFEKIRNANELPRIWLTMAIVDEGRFSIDTGVARWGSVADVSELDHRAMAPRSSAKGKFYSNKAPGMSLLAVPAYAVMKWLSDEPPSLRRMTYWFRLTASTLPALLFLWLLSFYLAEVVPDRVARRVALTGYALGSLAFTYGVLLIAHQLAATFAMTAFIVTSLHVRGRLGERWLIAAGAAAGMALLTDYQAVFVCVPVAVYLIVRCPRRVRGVAWAALGAAVPVGLLLGYHQAAFGSPLATGYAYSKTFAHLHGQGFLGLQWPPMGTAFVGSFFTPDNGLFALSPVFLLALPGLVLAIRARETRAEGIVSAAALVIGAWFVSSIAMWRGGWNVGPRYIASSLPFLVVPIAITLAALRARARTLPGGILWALAVATVVLSIAIYSVLTAVYPHIPSGQFKPVFGNPLYDVGFELLGRGYAPYSMGWLLGLHGLASLLPYFALVGTALAMALGDPSEPRRKTLWSFAGLIVGVGFIVLYGLVPQGRGSKLDCEAGKIWGNQPPCIDRIAAKYDPEHRHPD